MELAGSIEGNFQGTYPEGIAMNTVDLISSVKNDVVLGHYAHDATAQREVSLTYRVE